MNTSRALYESFPSFIKTIMRHDFHDDIGRVCNKVQNLYTVVRKTFKFSLSALQETFSDIINTAMRQNC